MSDGWRPTTVTVVAYDPAWPRLFEDLRAVLLAALGPLAMAVEHVGSTAVPGLAAKPIVDLDVVIATPADLPAAIAALAGLGYQHQGEQGLAGRDAFRQMGPDVPRGGARVTWPWHHLYVCARGNRELARHLACRDWLRAHPDDAAAYGALKRDLAARHAADREAYTAAKTAFLEALLARAGA